ncbi:lasso RiPP family leader peptide-containing protein [Desertimonas flava]|nr:lasso RiPP family leader peptide-containing protein [Desertimonas flava]
MDNEEDLVAWAESYESPLVVVFGDVVDTTLGSGGFLPDGIGFVNLLPE